VDFALCFLRNLLLLCNCVLGRLKQVENATPKTDLHQLDFLWENCFSYDSFQLSAISVIFAQRAISGQVAWRKEYTLLDALIAEHKPTAFRSTNVCAYACVPICMSCVSVQHTFCPAFSMSLQPAPGLAAKDDFCKSNLVIPFQQLVVPDHNLDT